MPLPKIAVASLLAFLPCAAPVFAQSDAPASVAPAAADPLLLAQVPADAQLCVAWGVLENPGYAGSRMDKFNQLSQRGPITVEGLTASMQVAFAPLLKEAHLS